MSIASPDPVSTPVAPFITIGDVLAKLPYIPPSRIRTSPTPGTATEADVLRVHGEEKRLCELFDGVLVEKGMGFLESVIAAYITTAINNFLEQHDLGIAAGEAGMLRLIAGQVRMPDVTFISWNQLPGRKFPDEPIWGIYPDLAVEVLSPSNTEREMERKRNEYFKAGTRLVWIVDPPSKTVRVYSAPTQYATVMLHESLDGGEVLPGLQLPLTRIFRN